MKFCKVCGKEITNKKRFVYCDDKCVSISKQITNRIYKKVSKQKYLKEKENWNYVKIEIGEAKHNNKIPLNQLCLTNSIRTHLKLLLRQHNLSVKEYVKMKRIDGMVKDFSLVVVSPEMIKQLFHARYEVYKQNFRLDCLRTVKTLVKVFDIVNNYDIKKVSNSNNK